MTVALASLSSKTWTIQNGLCGCQIVFFQISQSEGIIDMTVQELIEKLQVIEDKSQECLVNVGELSLWEISSVCEVENDVGVVWGYEKEIFVEIKFCSDI